MEIQLNSIAKQKFLLDTELSKFQEKKYTEKYRRRVLNHYDELLKFAVSEGIINEQEKYLLAFCHDVRNNLYHSIKEEKLFVAISIKVLKDIITKKQPHWKNTSLFTAHTETIIDPYKYKNLMSNSPEDWTKFLNQYFDFIDKRTLKPSNLLRKFILEKMRAARNNYKFLKNEFADYFPYAENWGFNEYIYYYYFKTLHAEKLREINEIEDKKEKDNSRKSLEEEYKNTWKKKKLSRIEAIEKKAKSMSNTDISKNLEIYKSLRDEINLISQGLENAASDLYAQIDLEAEMANGN